MVWCSELVGREGRREMAVSQETEGRGGVGLGLG